MVPSLTARAERHHAAAAHPGSARRAGRARRRPRSSAARPGTSARRTRCSGCGFTGHPHLVPLLLSDGFEGHPLRKDFVLTARVAKTWPGAKEPGESDATRRGPSRRKMQPPGVPDPDLGPAHLGAGSPDSASEPEGPDDGSAGGMSWPADRLASRAGARRVPSAAAARRPARAQGHGAHAGAGRPDVRGRLPRLGAAGRRRRQVRPEGGRTPSGRRPPGLPAGTCVSP